MPFQAFLWPCYFLDNGLSLSRARAVSCRVNLSHQLLFTLKEEDKILDKKHFTTEQAREIGDKLGIDWNRSSVEQFCMGLNVELEHGLINPSTDVTGDAPMLTGKIALAHLNEFADYYTRLKKMEGEAKKENSQA